MLSDKQNKKYVKSKKKPKKIEKSVLNHVSTAVVKRENFEKVTIKYIDVSQKIHENELKLLLRGFFIFYSKIVLETF